MIRHGTRDPKVTPITQTPLGCQQSLQTAVSRHGLTTRRRRSTPPPATPARRSTPTVVATHRHSLSNSPPGTDPSLTAGVSPPPPRPGWPTRHPQSRRPVAACQLDTQHEQHPRTDPHRREPLSNETHSTIATTRRLTTTAQTRTTPLRMASQLAAAAGRRRHHSPGRQPLDDRGSSRQPAGGGRPRRQRVTHSDDTASSPPGNLSAT